MKMKDRTTSALSCSIASQPKQALEVIIFFSSCFKVNLVVLFTLFDVLKHKQACEINKTTIQIQDFIRIAKILKVSFLAEENSEDKRKLQYNNLHKQISCSFT